MPTEYVFDVPLFNNVLRERLAGLEHADADYDARILADRVTSRLAPTRRGVVLMEREDADERVRLACGEVEDADVRTRVTQETLDLMQALSATDA